MLNLHAKDCTTLGTLGMSHRTLGMKGLGAWQPLQLLRKQRIARRPSEACQQSSCSIRPGMAEMALRPFRWLRGLNMSRSRTHQWRSVNTILLCGHAHGICFA